MNRDLFHQEQYTQKNVLPKDGSVELIQNVLSLEQESRFFHSLCSQIHWQSDEIQLFGKKIITKRKVAWYGDEAYNYTYSHSTKVALAWSSSLKELKLLVENISKESFNSCLLNLYQSGEEGMSWHADNEKELQKHGAIASLSLGAERKFSFKHKTTGEKVNLNLAGGSLLIMRGNTQEHWLHQLPKSKKVTSPRINLTFRTIENHS